MVSMGPLYEDLNDISLVFVRLIEFVVGYIWKPRLSGQRLGMKKFSSLIENLS
jgi:hypothetical protein